MTINGQRRLYLRSGSSDKFDLDTLFCAFSESGALRHTFRDVWRDGTEKESFKRCVANGYIVSAEHVDNNEVVAAIWLRENPFLGAWADVGFFFSRPARGASRFLSQHALTLLKREFRGRCPGIISTILSRNVGCLRLAKDLGFVAIDQLPRLIWMEEKEQYYTGVIVKYTF